MPEVAGELAEEDDAQEDQADDQHYQDDVEALLVRRLPRGEKNGLDDHAHRREILINPFGVQRQGSLDGLLRGLGVAEAGDRLRPRPTVATLSLGPQMGAQGEQLGQSLDRLDVPERRDADEAVRVEVVPEKDAASRSAGEKSRGRP